MVEGLEFLLAGFSEKKHSLIRPMLSQLGEEKRLRYVPFALEFDPSDQSAVREIMDRQIHRLGPKIVERLKSACYRAQIGWARRYFREHPRKVAVAWNGFNASRAAFMAGAKASGARTLYVESSPMPGRITVDPTGINFENSLPRVPAPYLKWFHAVGRFGRDWRSVRSLIRQRKSDRLDVAPRLGYASLDEPFVFVALQVPNDSQLRVFGGQYKTVERFVEAIASASEQLPSGWHARIKDHPSSPASIAPILKRFGVKRVVLDNETDTFLQVSRSRAVFTINSSVGLESFYFDKPVVACGQCFWAFGGMARAATSDKAIIECFRDVEGLDFDLKVREAFMSYLDQVYYIDPAESQIESSVEKIRMRLVSGRGPAIW